MRERPDITISEFAAKRGVTERFIGRNIQKFNKKIMLSELALPRRALAIKADFDLNGTYSHAKATYMLLLRPGETNMLLIVPNGNTYVAFEAEMKSLLQQIKDRRTALKLKQGDMLMRAGFSRQQYQRLEASGNPRLGTLEVLAKGLESELLLIPNEKLAQVLAILDSDNHSKQFKNQTALDVSKMSQFWLNHQNSEERKKNLSIDPWDEELGDNE